MSTSVKPITDAVKAALYYAKPNDLNIDELDFAYDQIAKHVTDYDRERVCSQLAAAARILADEVERLRGELNTNKTIIEHELNTMTVHLKTLCTRCQQPLECHWPAEMTFAGEPCTAEEYMAKTLRGENVGVYCDDCLDKMADVKLEDLRYA